MRPCACASGPSLRCKVGASAPSSSSTNSGRPSAPEQLGMAVLGGGHQLLARGDELRRDQVVAGQSELAFKPSAAAPERIPADADRRDAPARHRQPVGLGLSVDVAPRRPCLHLYGRPLAVHPYAPQLAQVDDHAAFDDRRPTGAVGRRRTPTAAARARLQTKPPPRRRRSHGSGGSRLGGGQPRRCKRAVDGCSQDHQDRSPGRQTPAARKPRWRTLQLLL